MQKTLLREGENCWRVARAHRAGLLVDGDSYYSAFMSAAERARHSIWVLAWDFDSCTRLRCDDSADATPPLLGDFLNWLAKRRRGLRVHVLIWDYPLIFGTDREFPSGYGIGWKPHQRVLVRYDNTHPFGACHHQKIVVIDDALAFCGGIDLTSRRWDTCEHRPDDERRAYEGDPYPPFHDVMMLVDGAAARALGDLARERWARATGRTIRAERGDAPPDAWPDEVEVAARDVDVGISRTHPTGDDGEGVREIEALYVDLIGAARRCVYIENQYFTSESIGAAVARRLAEPDGPEIVVVLRLLSHGWLEEMTMHNLRKSLIARLRAADVHGRLSVYYPHIEGLREDTCIDVHAKLMIVDDEWLRIGSANACNRSMGLDTECDLTIEARGRGEVREAIAAFRERLLGEHLGVEPKRVQATLRERGSIREAIAALHSPGRTLRELSTEEHTSEPLVTLAGLADPEAPVQMESLVTQFAPRTGWKPATGLWMRIAVVLVLIGALTAMWRYTPLAEWTTAERIVFWAEKFASAWWAPLAVMLAYTPAAIVMFPRALITLFAVVAFDAWLGFTYAMTGILFAAFLSYVAGMRFERSTVRRLAGPKIEQIVRVLRRRGLVAMTALRVVPLAPFTIEGVVAGAIRIRMFDFMAGTFLGMLPGTLAATVFGEQLEAALRNPSDVNPWLLGVVVVAIVAATLGVRRWLLSAERTPDATAAD